MSLPFPHRRRRKQMSAVNEILAQIGAAGRQEDGGYFRGCYSPEYFQAVDIVERQMQKIGMETDRDAAGNIHGVLPGNDPKAKSVVIGSHLDTVPGGGLYDGAYGVAAGLAVAKRLREEGKILRHTLEVYGFHGEESNPLGGTFGSRAIAGQVKPDQPGLAEALAAYGHNVREILDCRRDFSGVKCYLEAHIEQGDLLEQEGLKIGVVSGIVSVIRYRVTALGQSNHAGTTMMKNRRDAMVAMARLIAAADEECRKIDDTLVFTVGTIACQPGSENVIPGRVECTFEMRHMKKEKTDCLIGRIREIAAGIGTADFEITNKIDKGSVSCDSHLMEVISRSASEAGICHRIMASGAGHDANPMAHVTPIGMIFVPSRGGLSHCKEEWTSQEELESGTEVLYRTVLHLDEEAKE